MTKYVRGMKRNQIIQRWLQGIEDPDYDVFPTKRDGKYIVKPKQSKITEPVSQTDSLTEPSSLHESIDELSQDIPDPVDQDDSVSEPTPKSTIHMNSMPVKQYKPPIQRSNYDSISNGNFAPQTINLEILEQLRNLGDELRNDRFKREQKQYIKHVVNKELSKKTQDFNLNESRIRSKFVPDMFPDTANESVNQNNSDISSNIKSNDQVKTESDIQPEQPICRADFAKQIFRSRIRR